MTWGKGKWPSMQYVLHRQLCARIYGGTFPVQPDAAVSPYGRALGYADMKWNGGRHTGDSMPAAGNDIVGRYQRAVAGGAEPLPFTLYVPRGYASNGNGAIPNVRETDDPALIFTASFNDSEEVWAELSLDEVP